MTPDDESDLIAMYTGRLQQFGVSPETLGWGPKDRRELRFEALCSLWDFRGATILDFGCGFGDLLPFLTARYTGVRYIGVDINPDLIAHARRLHPDGHFEATNLLRTQWAEPVDFVLASGVFNDRIRDNDAFTSEAFAAFDAIARVGFAANFLSTKVDYRYDHAYYTEPQQALELCYRYSRNVVLRNDVMPFEFTVFVNKATQIDTARGVFVASANPLLNQS